MRQDVCRSEAAVLGLGAVVEPGGFEAFEQVVGAGHVDGEARTAMWPSAVGSRASVFGSPTVNSLFNQIYAVHARLMLMPTGDSEARAIVARVELGRIRDELQKAVRRELGTDSVEIMPDPRTTETPSPAAERPI